MTQRTHPDNELHQIDLTLFNHFLAGILVYPEELLDAKTKADIYKVITNLKLIKVKS